MPQLADVLDFPDGVQRRAGAHPSSIERDALALQQREQVLGRLRDQLRVPQQASRRSDLVHQRESIGERADLPGAGQAQRIARAPWRTWSFAWSFAWSKNRARLAADGQVAWLLAG